MPSIDERVVSMAFENHQFEARVAQTMATLAKLDTSIKNIGGTSGFDKIEAQASKVTLNAPMSALDRLKAKLGGAGAGAAEGLGGIERAGSRVTLEGPNRALDKTQSKMNQLSAGSTFSNIERAAHGVTLTGLISAIEKAGHSFSLLEGIASNALGGIASNAAMKGAAFAKSFAFGPIQQGFDEYSTNLNSIQTVLANTAAAGTTLADVNGALKELNTYSDQTIYNFGQMAENVGKFTSAGVDLKTSVASIKGLSNVAAISGASSEKASHAMYQLSQGIASGKIGVQDWNSVVQADMGGAVFQKALAETAVATGELSRNAVTYEKASGKMSVHGTSFRNSIMALPGAPPSWLTSDVLTDTLKVLTGDLTDQQVAAMGYSMEQVKAIQLTARNAKLAATEVKTISQVFDVAKESIGSGWASTFQLIFGDFNESKKLFTTLSQTLGGFINKTADARNNILETWKAAGGRTELIEGIKRAFAALSAVITPIKEAFRDIFPRTTGQQLFELTQRFSDFMQSLKIGPDTADLLKRSFAGLFALWDIGWTIVRELVGVFFDLFGVVGKGSGGFLKITASIGDFLVAVRDALTEGGLLHEIFEGIGTVLKIPVQLIKLLAGGIASLFTGGGKDGAKGFEDTLDGVNQKLGPLKNVLDVVVNVWNTLLDAVGKAKTALDPWFSAFADKLSSFGDILTNAFKNMDFEQVLSVVQTGLVAGLLVMIKKAFGDSGVIGSLKGSLDGISGVLGGLTGQLEAMQKKVQAQTILTIAAAITVLAAGIYILSKIDGKALSKAMTAVAVGLGELMGSMKLMMGGMGRLGILQLPVIAGSLVVLALAVTILAGAIKIFATMSWEDIAKGLVGIAGALVGIGLAMQLMSGLKMMAVALAMIPLGIGLTIIAGVVKIFASMSWEDMVKGLLGMASAIALIANAMMIMPPNLPLTAAGLLILGIGLTGVATAVKAFGAMDILTLVKGLGAMVLAIAGIGLAVSLIPPTIALSAAGLLIVGQAMVVTAGAVALLGSMSIGTLVKGIVALAATLIVLAAGLTLMVVALPGAAALMVAAGALAILVPVIGLLGTMKWDTIFKGLAAIGLSLITIGIAGLLAAPGLAALSLALIPMGIGMLLVAKAAQLFAEALQIMGSQGQKGVAVMIAALTGFIAILPTIVIQFVKGLLSIVDEIAKLAPKVVIALGVIIDTIIAFVIETAPKLAVAIGVLILSVLQVFVANTPRIIAAGAKLLMDLLNGISSNIGQITTKVSEIMIKFMEALQTKTPELIEAGFKLLTTFLSGISSHFSDLATTVGSMITQFVSAVATQYVRIATVAGTMMLKFLGGIAAFIPRLVGKGAEIILRFLDGLSQNTSKIVTKGADVIIKFIDGITSNINKIANKGADAVIKFLNGLEATIRTKGPQLRKAGWGVADALLDGMWAGIDELGHKIVEKLGALVNALPKAAKKLLGISSPSTVFQEIGGFMMDGMSAGIESGARGTINRMESTAKDVANSAKLQLGRTSMLDGVMDAQPVITPVLDLSNVHKEATKLDDLGAVVPITAAASFGQAEAISAEKTAADVATEEQLAARATPTLNFEQNNYSPEALNDIEIYRRTRNQLGAVKQAVGLP